MTKKLNTAALVASVDSFPPLPAVVTQVMQAIASPESSADDLVKIIERDQALVAAVLKMANSPFFGLSRSVSSLQQAMTILGFDGIKNLVISKAVFGTFSNFSAAGDFDPNALWHHSTLVAIACRILAEETGQSSMDLFVAGLIHDLGKLLLALALPEGAGKAFANPCMAAVGGCSLEESKLGMSHPEVGYALLRKWLFPQILMDATRYHHSPEDAENNAPAALIVYLADLIAHIVDADGDERLRAALHSRFLNEDIVEFAHEYDITIDQDLYEQALERLEKEIAENPPFPA